jgi:predicted ATP-grasp superfamily ATP-dependent carboligase
VDDARALEDRGAVLTLGGDVNALALMRSLGRRGISVRAAGAPRPILSSRYCSQGYPIPAATAEEAYAELLLSDRHPEIDGSVLLVCGDDAIGFVARNHGELERRYTLERHEPELQLCLLDKQRTLELAREVGVPCPGFWAVHRREDVDVVLQHATYPIMLKPRHTHRFRTLRGAKYLLAHGSNELREKAVDLIDSGIAFMACEMIPGPDDLSRSYYTYRGEDGGELLHLTKRGVRRNPINEGMGTYQVTMDLPEVEALGRRFFDAIGYRGIGNLEFKLDPRDGVLKLMECNNRFTAVTEQLVQSGADVGLMTYRDLTGQPVAPVRGCRPRVAIWSPVGDVLAFRQVRARTGASWADWKRSLSHDKLVFPCFSWSDPRPFLESATGDALRAIRRALTGSWRSNGSRGERKVRPA